MKERMNISAQGATSIGQVLRIAIRTEMTPEAYEKLEDRFAGFLRNEGLEGFIEDDVTGNTTAFGITIDTEICTLCGASVKPGSGSYVNRVPDLNDYQTKLEQEKAFPQGQFICAACDEKDSAKKDSGNGDEAGHREEPPDLGGSLQGYISKRVRI